MIINGVKYEEITDKGLTVTIDEGKRQTIAADTILLALPLSPDNRLLQTLKSKNLDLNTVGDCNEPRLILDAIADGPRIAYQI